MNTSASKKSLQEVCTWPSLLAIFANTDKGLIAEFISNFFLNQVIGLYPALVNCISTGSNSLCSALKEALIEYHQLLAVPRPVVLTPALPEPDVVTETILSQIPMKDAQVETVVDHVEATNTVSTEETAFKVGSAKVEVTAKVDAAGDADLDAESDPVGEVVLDVNVASEELDDSLC